MQQHVFAKQMEGLMRQFQFRCCVKGCSARPMGTLLALQLHVSTCHGVETRGQGGDNMAQHRGKAELHNTRRVFRFSSGWEPRVKEKEEGEKEGR